MTFLNAIKEFWGTVKALGEITRAFAKNGYWSSEKNAAAPKFLERYELHQGGFREEFEREGKASYCFYLHPADTHFYNMDESSWTLEDYGVRTWDYFALRQGNEKIEENCLQNKGEWFQENAELSIISDYDHAVWTILLSEGYPYELLKARLQVFSQEMGFPLQIKE